ncbi:MAG: hypothetical protein B6244_04850 [Candidatus Cloacimonetes bacterium 4572_55]|nr:MAG: hypothetical protein B6244_04850 [Candidatus Cloacimonetes bacterium 4572_55]
MKLAYLSTFYPYRGGIAQSNASLYRALEARVQVNAYTFTRQYPDLLFPGQTQYVRDADKPDPIPAERVLDSINPFTYFSSVRKIADEAPDVLVMRFWMPFFAPSLGTTANRLRKKGVKILSILDNVIPHEKRPGDTQLIRFFLNQNDGFIAMCQQVKKDLHRFRPDAQCVVKPHPLYDHFPNKISKEEARTRLNLPVDQKILLFFGFIRSYKGLDILIQAMAGLPNEYTLVIAGEAYGSFDKYERLIETHGVRDKVQIHARYIDDDTVQNYFNAADVCVLPYKSATQSGIVQIAYHFHTPVIVTDVGGLSEMVTDGQTGLVISSQDPEDVARAVERFFTMRKTTRFVENIADRRQEYSWSGFATTLLDLCSLIKAEIQ